jgi:hypothetical protein
MVRGVLASTCFAGLDKIIAQTVCIQRFVIIIILDQTLS